LARDYVLVKQISSVFEASNKISGGVFELRGQEVLTDPVSLHFLKGLFDEVLFVCLFTYIFTLLHEFDHA